MCRWLRRCKKVWRWLRSGVLQLEPVVLDDVGVVARKLVTWACC